jgi:hypothetical protein
MPDWHILFHSKDASVTVSGNPLVSIHMQSNRPAQFTLFLDRLEESISDSASVEVIVKIDDNDLAMQELLPKEQKRRPFALKYICTPLPDGFYGLWESMNDMLKVCDPDAYFVLNLNDEMHFSTKGWDSVIRKYVGLFPDNIFRLRTSDHRHRNYIDPWECGFAPESAAFTTRKWLQIGGDWCPCTGPDTFQQMVAYYLAYGDRFATSKPNRDIAIEAIGIKGEGGSHGMSWSEMRVRMRGAIGPWFGLMSYKMRTEAYRRAAKLHAHIYAHETGIKTVHLNDRRRRRYIELFDESGQKAVRRFSYRLCRGSIGLQNLVRRFNYGFYGGAGESLGKTLLRNYLGYLCLRYALLDRLRMTIRGQSGSSDSGNGN